MPKTATKPIRILIADDHSLMRVGLNALFSHQPDMEVIGEARDGMEAVRLAEKLDPDVIVMDLMMPKLDGADATQRILDVSPDAKVVILTSYGTSDDLVRAVANGVKGAMIKSAPIEEIVDAIRTVHAGGESFPPEVRQFVAETPRPAILTERQKDILHSATRGLTTEEIAKQYGISVSCVLKHFTSIFRKLDVTNRTEAITVALRKQLLKA
ncbi:MAG: response regulator transcription factor [Kiritimatiellae bacterium]|nr:response regulator transcription factor [Kiritimatiellia bacterium]